MEKHIAQILVHNRYSTNAPSFLPATMKQLEGVTEKCDWKCHIPSFPKINDTWKFQSTIILIKYESKYPYNYHNQCDEMESIVSQ